MPSSSSCCGAPGSSPRRPGRPSTGEVPRRSLWQPNGHDITFCRNVLMYFAPESAQLLVDRITAALRPGGYLFLGHAETLRGLSNAFHLRHTHGTFYYERRDGPPSIGEWTAAAPSVRSAASAAALADLVDGADTWVEAIQRAAQRIEALVGAPRPSGPALPHATRGATPPWDLGVVLELVRQERFTDALRVVQTLPPESTSDPEVLLLHAVLLTHCGQLSRAEEVGRRLIEREELNAGAHYVLALCREGAGDRNGAIHHDQVAAYLDPGFAMPHLHLGLLARRAGDRTTARRELGLAIALFQREDPSRLLLSGGGFGREALVTLSRTELQACGGMA